MVCALPALFLNHFYRSSVCHDLCGALHNRGRVKTYAHNGVCAELFCLLYHAGGSYLSCLFHHFGIRFQFAAYHTLETRSHVFEHIL